MESAIVAPAVLESAYVGTIPVRNLWLLMLYASRFFRQLDSKKRTAIEENPEDMPDLVAEILAYAVEQRLMRNLSFGYRPREAELSRVRGRIDLLNTESHKLLDQGKVACRFEDLTINTPRNRFVRAALEKIASIVHQQELAHRCRALAGSLEQLGVSGDRPSRAELSTDRFGHHDSRDRFMVSAAQLAFNLALPTEDPGIKHIAPPEREFVWVTRLYEKAVGGFYSVVLSPEGWSVSTGRTFNWSIEGQTAGVSQILPSMITDIILDRYDTRQRIVIDTKFTSILRPGRFGNETLKSEYIYQIYTYLRSQENVEDPLALHASGLLLHPSIGETVDETVMIQGHSIRFATVNLCATARDIRDRLIQMVDFPNIFPN